MCRLSSILIAYSFKVDRSVAATTVEYDPSPKVLPNWKSLTPFFITRVEVVAFLEADS